MYVSTSERLWLDLRPAVGKMLAAEYAGGVKAQVMDCLMGDQKKSETDCSFQACFSRSGACARERCAVLSLKRGLKRKKVAR